MDGEGKDKDDEHIFEIEEDEEQNIEEGDEEHYIEGEEHNEHNVEVDEEQHIEVEEGDEEQYIEREERNEHNIELECDKEHIIEDDENNIEVDEERNIEVEEGDAKHCIEGEGRNEHNIEECNKEHIFEVNLDEENNTEVDEDEEEVKLTTVVVNKKLRTERNKRVSKRILSLSGSKNKKTKGLSAFSFDITQEIYTIDDDIDSEEDEEQSLPYKPLKIPTKFLPPLEMLRLKALHHATNGANEVYWSSPNLELRLRDITPIFSKAFTSSNLIDAWGYFLMKDQENSGRRSGNQQIEENESLDMSGKSCFVTSMIWALVTGFNNAKIDALLKNQLDQAQQNDVRFIHFPMSSPGFANSSKFDAPNHWTLLVFNTHRKLWSFYNSLRPRTKDSKDYYFAEAMAVVDRAHEIMNERREMLVVERVIDSPQQGDTTVDCGYIVMKIMECYANNKAIPKVWTAKQMKEFKTYLLMRIVNDENAVKPEEYLNAQTAAQVPETSEDVVFLKMV